MTVKRKKILMKRMRRGVGRLPINDPQRMRRGMGRRLINDPRSRQAKGATRRETFGDKTREWLPRHGDGERRTVTRHTENVRQRVCNVVLMWLCKENWSGVDFIASTHPCCTVLSHVSPTVAWIISIFKSFWSHPCFYMHVIFLVIFSTSLLVPVLVWGQSSFCTKTWKTCQIWFLSKHISCTVLYFIKMKFVSKGYPTICEVIYINV